MWKQIVSQMKFQLIWNRNWKHETTMKMSNPTIAHTHTYTQQLESKQQQMSFTPYFDSNYNAMCLTDWLQENGKTKQTICSLKSKHCQEFVPSNVKP